MQDCSNIADAPELLQSCTKLYCTSVRYNIQHRADSMFAPSQWETSLQSNTISPWLDANLGSALQHIRFQCHVTPKMTVFAYQDGKIGFWNDSQPDHKPFSSGRVEIVGVAESLEFYLLGDYSVMVPWYGSVWDGHLDLHGSRLQYIPRNMHTVFALLCFVVVIH